MSYYYERQPEPESSYGAPLLSPPPSVDDDADTYSLISLRSSQVDAYFDTDYDGRLLQNRNNTYLLPADDEEIDRLSAQNHMLYMRNSSLYVGPLAETLEEAQATGFGVPTVLDVGCGGGDWIIAIARQFPFAVCLGADLVPVQRSSTWVPENCSFELADVDQSVPWPENSFDVIHVRDINVGITNYNLLVEGLVGCLRPGGMILLSEPEVAVWSAADDHVVPVTLENFITSVRSGLESRGIDPDVSLHLYAALLRTGALQDLHHDEIGTPLSDYMTGESFSSDPTLNQTGALNRACFDQYIDACKTLMLSEGNSREEVGLTQWHARDTLADPEARFFTRWFYCWGRRPTWAEGGR